MASASFLDLQGPPRKKMRKGTKSCTECRRRKIRCTYDQGRPHVCNECHSRGATCIDQEYSALDSNGPGILSGEQPYSLRERVTQLENVVRDIVQRMNENTPRSSASPTQESPARDEFGKVNEPKVLPINILPKSAEAGLTTAHQHIENAPVLQLFNNNVVTRTEGTANRMQDAAATKDLSPKAIAARSQLVRLILPRADLLKIRGATSKWWAAWHCMFPELCDKCRQNLVDDNTICEIPSSPGEVAKFLLCLLMSIEQLPSAFDYASLQVPLNPREYTDRCIAEIDRLIIYDDDLASTLPGIESMMLLSKWYTNMGRPRKAWLLNRRTIEFAQLTGLHLSTAKPPHPSDTQYDRRLRVWCSIGMNDRFLGLILGLPYAISDAHFKPQVELRLQREKETLEAYTLRLALVMGPMIERNQEDPANMSLAATLKLDQDLENYARSMGADFWSPDASNQLNSQQNNERLIIHFLHHFIRALLHLPFMLQSNNDRRYRYSHDAALESARNALISYNALRSWSEINPYICRIVDFQAFTTAMLLIIHLMGYSEDAPNHSQEQDDKDWALVDATTEVLRQVAGEGSGTVAAQSLHILDTISKSCPAPPMAQNMSEISCKITVPYFGVITVSPGRKLVTRGGCSLRGASSRRFDQATPYQLYTPPQSNPDDHNTNSKLNGVVGGDQTNNWSPSFMDESRVQLENIVAFPNTGFTDPNMFQGFTNDQSLGLWSNLNLDLDLDQGWNLNWTGDENSIIPQ